MAAAPVHNTAMDAPIYTRDQIDAYLNRIHLPSFNRDVCSYSALTKLVRHQLFNVPFETLGLHYSVDRTISLDPTALFDKIVGRYRGGYCLENNTFFGCILRSLGYRVYGVICRISKATWGVHDGSWRPMSHMANIVMLDGKKYLVDVGYGIDGPVCPLVLESCSVTTGLTYQRITLEPRTLPQHTDPSQKVWVYMQRRGKRPWRDVYHFADTEALPQDFDVLNFYNMTNSLWARTVVVQSFLAGKDGDVIGTRLLVGGELKEGDGMSDDQRTVEKCTIEGERLMVLSGFFDIDLTEEEANAIIGRPTALKSS